MVKGYGKKVQILGHNYFLIPIRKIQIDYVVYTIEQYYYRNFLEPV